ncbi:hypothetical protein MMC20_002236 [Loxospora ochrophaea]|nr:hypothetical protein [Loxospora ochrophaea]
MSGFKGTSQHELRDKLVDIPPGTLLSHEDTPAFCFQRLVGSFDAEDPISDVVNVHAEWYAQRLENRVIRKPLPTVFQALHSSILADEQTSSQRTQRIFKLFSAIVFCLQSKNQCAIHDITSYLLTQPNLLTEDINKKDLRHQLVFFCISQLTMLYPASANPTHRYFELASHHPSSSGLPRLRKRSRKSDQLISFKYPINDDTLEQPLSFLFNCFGQLVPEPLPSQSVKASDPLYADTLVVTNLDFYTLTKVAHIQIRWVDAICQHLHFDRHNSILSVFQFPSFCAALSWNQDSEGVFLSKFLSEAFFDGSSDLYSHLDPHDIYEEVLHTYRLIFGQQSRAFKAFRQCNFLQQISPEDYDPLLQNLCGQNCEAQEIYKRIDVGHVQSAYSARSHFPFFGKRLLSLQDFVLQRNPSDLKTLYYDRRDPIRFYTLWVVIYFDGASLLIAILQLGFAAAQTGSTYTGNVPTS